MEATSRARPAMTRLRLYLSNRVRPSRAVSGSEGDDLYFNVSSNGETYTFLVESYLCDKDSDVYKAVKNLQIGDTIDAEGFLYWYEGVNPHITAITVK